MKRIILTVSLFASSMAISQVATDKVLHFMLGAIVGQSTSYLVNELTDNPKKAFIISFASTLAVGLGKELYDQYIYGGFDLKDLLATSLGGLSVTIPMSVFQVNRKNKKINQK